MCRQYYGTEMLYLVEYTKVEKVRSKIIFAIISLLLIERPIIFPPGLQQSRDATFLRRDPCCEFKPLPSFQSQIRKATN